MIPLKIFNANIILNKLRNLSKNRSKKFQIILHFPYHSNIEPTTYDGWMDGILHLHELFSVSLYLFRRWIEKRKRRGLLRWKKYQSVSANTAMADQAAKFYKMVLASNM